MKTIDELQRVLDPAVARAAGAVRRMAITLTARALWQLTGFRLPGSGASSTTETTTAEPFLGIGFHARPPANGKAEAIVIMVGDAGAPAVIAVRDERTRAAVAGALLPDESAVFNSRAIVHLTAAGKIDARSEGGSAVPLAKASDLSRLLDALTEAISASSGAAPEGAYALGQLKAALAVLLPPWPDPTTTLQGE